MPLRFEVNISLFQIHIGQIFFANEADAPDRKNLRGIA